MPAAEANSFTASMNGIDAYYMQTGTLTENRNWDLDTMPYVFSADLTVDISYQYLTFFLEDAGEAPEQDLKYLGGENRGPQDPVEDGQDEGIEDGLPEERIANLRARCHAKGQVVVCL